MLAEREDGETVSCQRIDARIFGEAVIDDVGEPMTVTVTAAEGEPKVGTLTLAIADGQAEETQDSDLPPRLEEYHAGYSVMLTWEDASDSGYGVVSRSDDVGSESEKAFVETNQFFLTLRADRSVRVAVYPVENEAAVRQLPSIIPGSDVSPVSVAE